MQDRFLTRYYDTKTEQIIKLNTIINTCENGIDIEFYGICVSGDGQISQVELDKNEQRFKRMQCSGLKDIEGTLIYEGDIVKYMYYNPKRYTKWTVVFDQNTLEFGLKDYKYGGYLRITRHSILNNKVKIIGNIYENPELIGGEE